MSLVEWGEDERKLTDRVSVLVGRDNVNYPSGNTLIVRGESECFVIDPSVDVVARGGAPVEVDAVLNSHAHEDHIPGNKLFASARVHIHEDDVPGVTSLEGLIGPGPQAAREPTRERESHPSTHQIRTNKIRSK